MPSYAVRVGRQPGVYSTWADAEAQVKGFTGAKYKKFNTVADAEAWITGDDRGGSPSKHTSSTTVAAAGDNKGKKRGFTESADMSEDGWDVVYSDGACKGNGQPGSIAGVGVWWGPNDPRNIAERCPGMQTNNRAELIAILRVLETAPHTKRPLLIKTDSKYSIQCFQDWIPKWIQNGWKSTNGERVKNAELIRYISAQLEVRGLRGQDVRLAYVKGHSGDTGNDGADLQANIGATKPLAPERDWAALEAELRARKDAEFNAPRQAEPVLADVRNQRAGSAAREVGQSPTKMRKLAVVKESLKPAAAAPAAVSVPFYLTPQNVVKSLTVLPTAEDLEQYAEGWLDDNDLLADLSD